MDKDYTISEVQKICKEAKSCDDCIFCYNEYDYCILADTDGYFVAPEDWRLEQYFNNETNSKEIQEVSEQEVETRTIYYFAEPFSVGDKINNNYKNKNWEDISELISFATYEAHPYIQDITSLVFPEIITETVKKYDFYCVQLEIDGDGHNTVTLACFKTKSEAIEYLNTNYDRINGDYCVIVGQRFNEKFIERFN